MGKDNYNLFQYEKKRVKVRKRWIDPDIFLRKKEGGLYRRKKIFHRNHLLHIQLIWRPARGECSSSIRVCIEKRNPRQVIFYFKI
jgi:hypothetical protein